MEPIDEKDLPSAVLIDLPPVRCYSCGRRFKASEEVQDIGKVRYCVGCTCIEFNVQPAATIKYPPGILGGWLTLIVLMLDWKSGTGPILVSSIIPAGATRAWWHMEVS